MGKQDSGVTGVPRGMQPPQDKDWTVTHLAKVKAIARCAGSIGSRDEVNDGDIGGAEEEVGGKHLSKGTECPTVAELIWDDDENQAEDCEDDQDGAMEEGEDESEPSRAGDEIAHAMVQGLLQKCVPRHFTATVHLHSS